MFNLANLVVHKFCNAFYNCPCISKSGHRADDASIWSIHVKQKGTTVYTYKNKQVSCNKNTILILPAHLPCAWQNIELSDYSRVSFQCNISHNEAIAIKCEHTQGILDKIKKLANLKASSDPYKQMRAIKEIYEILLELASIQQMEYRTSANKERLKPVLEYIEANYASPITNDTLAGISGLSVSYFRKCFGSVCGTSPMQYVQKIRIEKAKDFLIVPEEKISNIATSVGYRDVYEFSRAFKRQENLSPTQYRKLFSIGN